MRTSYVLLALLSMVFSQFGRAAHVKEERTRRAVAPPMDPLLAKLMTIRGEHIASDSPGELSFEFIGPNESFSHFFESCIKLTNGALVTVGTFRGLDNASSGKFEHLVQMDFNRGVYLFNLINAQLIAMSSDRYEYLSLLMTGEKNTQQVAEARRAKTPPYQFALKLTKKLQVAVPDETMIIPEKYRLGPKWRQLGVKLPLADDWKLINGEGLAGALPIENHVYRSEGNDRHKSILNSLSAFQTLKTIEHTIFGNDQRFERIKRMILDGRVTVALGDLAGQSAMRSIASDLSAKQIPIAAVDVSNILSGYFGIKTGETPPTRTLTALFAKMFENITRLASDSNTRVFLTAHHQRVFDEILTKRYGKDYWDHGGPDRNLDSWNYYVLSPQDLADVQQLNYDQAVKKQGTFRSEDILLDALFTPDPSDKTGYQILKSSPSSRCR